MGLYCGITLFCLENIVESECKVLLNEWKVGCLLICFELCKLSVPVKWNILCPVFTSAFKEIYVANVEVILTYPYRFQKWMLWKTQQLQATFIGNRCVMCNIFLVQRAFHVLSLILIMPRLWFHYFEQFTPVNTLYYKN